MRLINAQMKFNQNRSYGKLTNQQITAIREHSPDAKKRKDVSNFNEDETKDFSAFLDKNYPPMSRMTTTAVDFLKGKTLQISSKP